MYCKVMYKFKRFFLTIVFASIPFFAFSLSQDITNKYPEYFVAGSSASQDGQFKFYSLYSKTQQKALLICTDTKSAENSVLLETEYPLAWCSSSIIYSDISETVYAYINGPDNGNGVYKYQGLYSFKKENGKFNSEKLKRYHVPQDWMFEKAISYYLSDNNPDYDGFLEYIYSFSDTCEKTFCIADSNGKLLTGVEALKYCKENNKLFDEAFNFLNLYMKRIENNEIIDQSAFTINGNPQLINGFLQKCLNDAFFLKNSDGIWLLQATNKEYKKTDNNGNKTSAWLPAYHNIFLLEDSSGKIAQNTPSGLEFIQFSPDRIDFSVSNDYLVFKNRTGQPYYAFRNNKLFTFESYDQAIEFTNSSKKEPAVIKNIPEETPVLTEKNKIVLIVLFSVITLLAVTELIFIIYIKSNHYKTHLNKKDKKLIFRIQDEERSKVSKDIHDSVVQNIRAIRLDAEMLEVKDNSIQRKNKIVEEMTNVITLLRNICYNLSPAELSLAENMDNSNVELLSVIDTLSKQFTAKTKIPCSINLEKDIILPELEVEVSKNVVRIVQECFNNIEKHSFATRVQILVKNEIKNNTRKLILFIIDDGIGCEIKNLMSKKTHFGIRNMVERMKMIGGTIEFFSEPNEGLSIQLQIPYGE